MACKWTVRAGECGGTTVQFSAQFHSAMARRVSAVSSAAAKPHGLGCGVVIAGHRLDPPAVRGLSGSRGGTIRRSNDESVPSRHSRRLL